MAPASTPDKHPPPEAFHHTIQVQVGCGDNEKIFDLHKGVLEFYSGYFEGALRGDFTEALSGKITLVNEDVTIFELFVHWLYTRHIYFSAKDTSSARQDRILCDLWLFADRRQVPLLMNACIDGLRDAIVKLWTVPTRQLKKIFENTTPDAGLRRFCVTVIANACDSTLLDEDPWYFSRECLLEIMKLTWKRGEHKMMTKEVLKDLDLCQYHWHDKGETCKGKST